MNLAIKQMTNEQLWTVIQFAEDETDREQAQQELIEREEMDELLELLS